ncbi:uncharacterized protein V6R79_004049 [Siganus canaliculatus]
MDAMDAPPSLAERRQFDAVKKETLTKNVVKSASDKVRLNESPPLHDEKNNENKIQ